MATEPVRSLFVTLRRGMAGKPWYHVRIVNALGLRARHHTVEKPNNDSIRGMLAKIPHLVIVESDRMFHLRRMRDYYQQLQRAPIVVHHSQAVTAHLQHQQQRESQPQPQPDSSSSSTPATAPAAGPLVSSISGAVRKQAPYRPLQSVLLRPHLQEHMTPISSSATWQPKEKPLRAQLVQLLAKRGRVKHKQGLFEPKVRSLNQQIAAVKLAQEQRETKHRQRVLFRRFRPGATQVRVRAAGAGSRRGLLAQARSEAPAREVNKEQQAVARVRKEQQQWRSLAASIDAVGGQGKQAATPTLK